MSGPPTRPEPARRFGLFTNWLSMAGAALAVLGLANVLFLLALDIIEGRGRPYVGIFAYLVFPAVMVFGLVLVPVGVLLERRRRRRHAPDAVAGLRIDLGRPAHRRALGIFLALTIFFVALSTLGSYRAHQFSDSVTFCGGVCHTVMEPQATAYHESPHARVPCVECHVGPGATWFVRAKLSGMYQVYAVARDIYPRPIPSPIKSLRPAQETCEHCHWPEKFWGAQLKVVTRFSSDERNTARETRMLIKTGGGSPTAGLTTGIHWHMNINNEVWYVATDPQRQEIPWVKIKDRDGRVTEYLAKDAKLTPEEAAAAPRRRMDCMDCHNRPSHVFKPPDRAVDEALLAGRIDRSLPFVKREAVAALSGPYESVEAAREGIATRLDRFYFEQHRALHAARQPAIRAAIVETQRLYGINVFPAMRVDWRTHPNNIGHFYYPGCFRCHDGEHVSAEGKVISKDCDICHTVLGQQENGAATPEMPGQPFQHPAEIGELADANCPDCHGG